MQLQFKYINEEHHKSLSSHIVLVLALVYFIETSYPNIRSWVNVTDESRSLIVIKGHICVHGSLPLALTLHAL